MIRCRIAVHCLHYRDLASLTCVGERCGGSFLDNGDIASYQGFHFRTVAGLVRRRESGRISCRFRYLVGDACRQIIDALGALILQLEGQNIARFIDRHAFRQGDVIRVVFGQRVAQRYREGEFLLMIRCRIAFHCLHYRDLACLTCVGVILRNSAVIIHVCIIDDNCNLRICNSSLTIDLCHEIRQIIDFFAVIFNNGYCRTIGDIANFGSMAIRQGKGIFISLVCCLGNACASGRFAHRISNSHGKAERNLLIRRQITPNRLFDHQLGKLACIGYGNIIRYCIINLYTRCLLRFAIFDQGICHAISRYHNLDCSRQILIILRRLCFNQIIGSEIHITEVNRIFTVCDDFFISGNRSLLILQFPVFIYGVFRIECKLRIGQKILCTCDNLLDPDIHIFPSIGNLRIISGVGKRSTCHTACLRNFVTLDSFLSCQIDFIAVRNVDFFKFPGSIAGYVYETNRPAGLQLNSKIRTVQNTNFDRSISACFYLSGIKCFEFFVRS